jgi:hypothetical protein
MLKISGQNRFHAPTGDLTAATLKIRELGRRRNVQTLPQMVAFLAISLRFTLVSSAASRFRDRFLRVR